VGRPAKHSVDFKTRVVLGVLRGEMSAAEAARRHGVSETSIGKWKEAFIRAGREGLAPRADGRVTGEQARAAAEVDELTRALGEAHVELRLLRRERDGAGLPPTSSWR
jgi:transposase